MSMTPENPHIGKHDPQREADWNDGFEESRAHFTARIAKLEAEVVRLRAGLESVDALLPESDVEGCLNPGAVQIAMVLAGSDRPLRRANDKIAELEGDLKAAVEQRDAVAATDFPLWARLLALCGGDETFGRARVVEALEAQVRERGEALKVAGDALRWLVNVVCGVGKSGDYPSISEDGAAVDAAKSALANPLIGGAK